MSDKKKFSIQPFKRSMSIDANRAKLLWESLQKAIGEIHNMNVSQLSFEELYRNAYNLVLHKHGELLYRGVEDTVRSHLTTYASTITGTADEQLLSVLSAKWTDHKVIMVVIRDILMYMDRTYVCQNKKIPVYDMGLTLFRDTIVRNSEIKERLQDTLLSNIDRERRGQLIDRGLMKSTLAMMVDLGIQSTHVYEEDFEKPFLEATAQFYRAESQEYLDQNTCPDYLKKAETRLAEEANRVTHYLSPGTEPKLKHIMEKELIQAHSKTLVEMEGSGALSLFRDNKVQDLKRMYTLFSRIHGALIELKHAMSEHIKSCGSELVRNQDEVKDPVAFVQELLNLRDKFDKIVTTAFDGDKVFQRSLKEAFEGFMNTDSRTASYLALYIDEMLRSGLKGTSEEDVEQLFDKVIILFRYIQEKDVFECFYKQHLSRRLLSFRNVSDEAERSMIAKLKSECGHQFTTKLESMFSDMKLSKDAMDELRRSRGGKSVNGIEFYVSVLTTGSWPIQSASSCVFPPQIVACCEAFQVHYFAKHTGRRLTWHANMGSADIRATFGDRKYELTVSTYQMCILLLFNSHESLPYAEILNATQIPEPELKRHLISLTTPKAKILTKSAKSKTVEDDEVFTLNSDFKSKLMRVKVPLVSQKEKMSATIPQPVEEDRQHQIEASIVRIMKTRKKMAHNDLISEVTRQLQSRFVPSPQDIKKRIESLIEREYLERTKDDRRQYNYLA